MSTMKCKAVSSVFLMVVLLLLLLTPTVSAGWNEVLSRSNPYRSGGGLLLLSSNTRGGDESSALMGRDSGSMRSSSVFGRKSHHHHHDHDGSGSSINNNRGINSHINKATWMFLQKPKTDILLDDDYDAREQSYVNNVFYTSSYSS